MLILTCPCSHTLHTVWLRTPTANPAQAPKARSCPGFSHSLTLPDSARAASNSPEPPKVFLIFSHSSTARFPEFAQSVDQSLDSEHTQILRSQRQGASQCRSRPIAARLFSHPGRAERGAVAGLAGERQPKDWRQSPGAETRPHHSNHLWCVCVCVKDWRQSPGAETGPITAITCGVCLALSLLLCECVSV